MLRLFAALHQRSAALLETLEQLTTPIALDWFVARLTHHLTADEQLVLQELALFANEAPPGIWRRGQKRLENLIQLGLIEQSTHGIALHPALRKVLYARLPATRKIEMHLAAAQQLAERGRFTDAAGHYMQAEHPEMAIWTWYTHQQQEIQQGQASAALALFLPLAAVTLPRADDRRALVLLLALLLQRVGRAPEALALLEETVWPAQSVSASLAHERRGDLLAEMGLVERGLAEMRRGLEDFSRLRMTQEIELSLQMGRRTLARLGDVELTRRHVAEARISLDVLQGRLEEATGNYAGARTHFESALALAQQTTDPQRLAKIHEGLGVLEARYANLEAAVEHLDEAGKLYRHGGNQIAAVGITNSLLAMAYLIQRRHAEAVTPAETARAFFAELDHTYWVALNETYLAEAWLYLSDLRKAEAYAQSALRHEEVMVRPYCLFLLGHVRRQQGAFVEAKQFCRAAIDEAQSLHDRSAEAPAWLALAETARDANQPDEADEAFARAIEIYQQLGVAQEVAYAEQLRAGMGQLA
ncbi:MAG: tetratricopeptide repeat protein [Caldilineaceae bacterium]